MNYVIAGLIAYLAMLGSVWLYVVRFGDVKRMGLTQLCYLYKLERDREKTKHYHEHMDVERIRQGKVYLKGTMVTVPTKLGLAVPFIVEEDVVFIRRNEFIQAKDKLMNEIKELLKEKQGRVGANTRIYFDILTKVYEFREQWEVLRPSEFKDIYTTLSLSIDINLSYDEQMAIKRYFDSVYRFW